MNKIKKNYNIIAENLLSKYVNRISGNDVEEYIIGENPDERVMVGKLGGNRVEKSFDGVYKENQDSRYDSIPSITTTFIIDKTSRGNITIYPLGILYYRVCPSFEQFEEYVIKYYSEKYRENFQGIKGIIEYLEKIGQNDDLKLPAVYKKIQIDSILSKGFSINVEKLINEGDISLKDDINEKLKEKLADISTESIGALNRTFQLSSISNIKDYNLKVDQKEIENICPSWNFDIIVQVSELENGYRVSVIFVNLSEKSTRLSDSYSPSIFNAKIKIKGEKGIVFNDIHLDYFIEDYKNNVYVKAIPENCSCDFIEEDNTIVTEHIPIYRQNRLITRDKYNDNTSFISLLLDPIGNLKYILSEMRLDYNRLDSEEKKRLKKINSDEMIEEFNKDMLLYKEEIDRFDNGIKLIETNKKVYDAFKYMNLTFKKDLNIKNKSVSGWRLFQIVFIVSMINDIISDEARKLNQKAELLYFPTGGGKTEAFLGTVVFTMFYDRLRGKDLGISAFIKYPLRLLSINQLERVLTVILKAEAIRQENSISGNEFSVGYYVGGDNTPNRIQDINKFVGVSENILNSEYRIIDTCPVCGEKNVNVIFVESKWRLVHMCDNPNCKQKDLPLYIVDNEIYRYLPTVIISTVDKLSTVGTKAEFKMLFGQVKKQCKTHGFTYNDRCLEGYTANCNEALVNVKSLFDPVPTLFIQDELHLVRESLGTFASHYISFIDYYCRELLPREHRKNIKFVGATATIAMYKNHLWNLYHKDGRRFPAAYPSSSNHGDFYSEIDTNDVSRIIIGYAPYGRSVTDGVWQSTMLFREILHNMLENYKDYYKEVIISGFNGSENDLKNILNDYWIAINYNNTKQDSLELFNSFQNQANNYLGQKNICKFNIDKMTGDDTFQDVRKILFDIQATKDKKNCTNLVLATSTISHGVDEDSFNQMYFFGMPNNNAEYVQAYSRVGRKYTGIVVDIIRLARERDRSYLKNFNLFHEYKDSLIEPVPINRWAKNAIYSTLPGILSALLLQRNIPLEKAKDVKNAILNNDITVNSIIEDLIAAYGCSKKEKLSESYREAIKNEVYMVFDGFKNDMHGTNKTIDKLALYTIGKKRPMVSLRDTEEQVIISIK